MEAQTRTNQRITNRRETQTTSSLSTSISLSLSLSFFHSETKPKFSKQSNEAKAKRRRRRRRRRLYEIGIAYDTLIRVWILKPEANPWGREKSAASPLSTTLVAASSSISSRNPLVLSLYIYVCMYVCMCIKRIFFSSFEVCGSVRVSFLIKFKEDIFDSFSFCSVRVSFLMKLHVCMYVAV